KQEKFREKGYLQKGQETQRQEMAMKWLRTGLQIGRTVKNAQRMRHIVGVFARHGFEDIVHRATLSDALPSRILAKRFAERDTDKAPAQRLRESFEELGPAFVKLGQVMSTR